MDTAQFLRRHTTVIFNRPRGLVSPGAAWRFQKRREQGRRACERDVARCRAWSNNPDNPTLTAKRRAELRSLAEGQPGQGDRSVPA